MITRDGGLHHACLQVGSPVDSVHEWWEQRSATIVRVGHEALSITAGRRSHEIRIPDGGMIRCRR